MLVVARVVARAGESMVVARVVARAGEGMVVARAPSSPVQRLFRLYVLAHPIKQARKPCNRKPPYSFVNLHKTELYQDDFIVVVFLASMSLI